MNDIIIPHSQPTSRTDTDIDPPLAHLLHNAARSAAVRHQFSLIPPEEYTTFHQCKLFIATYNVNGRKLSPPPSSSSISSDADILQEWLGSGRYADIVAIGFQELVPLNATNVVLGAAYVNANAETAANQWDEAISNALNTPDTDSQQQNQKQQFVKVIGEQLVGMYISIWVKVNMLPHIRGVQTASVGTGVLGLLGNKGAVAVRMRVYDTSVAFVNSHLSSGDNEGDALRRHSDFSEIIRRGVFTTKVPVSIGGGGGGSDKNNSKDDGTSSSSSSSSTTGSIGDNDDNGTQSGSGKAASTVSEALEQVREKQLATEIQLLHLRDGHWGVDDYGSYLSGLLDVEHIIWLGDLNYRLIKQDAATCCSVSSGSVLMTSTSAKSVAAEIRKGNWTDLLHRDELLAAIKNSNNNNKNSSNEGVFQGWHEAPITFPPTFKYKRGSHLYLGEVADDTAATIRSRNNIDHDGAELLIQQEYEDGGAAATVPQSTPALTPPPPSSSSSSTTKQEKPEKVRCPAWTDRIIWRSASSSTDNNLKNLTYMAAPSLTLSDHRPVSAAFILNARHYVPDRVDAAVDIARKITDAQENSEAPTCSLLPNHVDVGAVEYGEEVWFDVVVGNNSNVVPAKWYLIPSLPSASNNGGGGGGGGGGVMTPAWVSVVPSSGMVEPGGTCTLRIKVCVAGGHASTSTYVYNKKDIVIGSPEDIVLHNNNTLDAILIIRVDKGNDMFLSVMGTYTTNNNSPPTSCFGLSPQTLSERGQLGVFQRLTNFLREEGRLRTPGVFMSRVDEARAAALTNGRPPKMVDVDINGSEGGKMAMEGLSLNDGEQERGEGKEAFLLKEDEEEQGEEEYTIIERIHVLRKCLDTNTPFPPSTTAIEAGATLICMFAALPKPLLPAAASEVCDVAVPMTPATAAELVTESSSSAPAELSVLEDSLDLFRCALKPEMVEENRLTAPTLAVLLVEVWFPQLPESLGAYSCGEGGMTEVALRNLQMTAESVAAVSMRRIQFIEQLLMLK